MLKLITWNICFDEKLMDQRFNFILEQIKLSNPDVCCFQECIPEFIGLMTTDNFWLDNYDFSDLDFVSSGYGTLVIAKKYLEFQFKLYDLTSRMNRKLVVGTNLDLTVGSVHLESLNSREIRSIQLEEIAGLLESYGSPSIVLCGDFNFCSNSNYLNPQTPLENDSLVKYLPEYKDLYTDQKTAYTWSSGRRQMRLDRIMLKSNIITPISKKLLGTSPIPGYVNTYPSDHKGLCVDFSII